MPLFKAEIFKDLGPGRKPWENVYHIFAATQSDAGTLAGTVLLPAEQAIHQEYVRFIRFRLTNLSEGPGSFIVQPLNATGTLSAFGNALPLWNVFRFDFTTDTGRPSRKLFRCPVTESDQDGGGIVGGAITRMNNDYSTPVFNGAINVDVAEPHLVDVDGQRLTSVSLYPFVQMLQTYKRRKRRNGSAPPIG